MSIRVYSLIVNVAIAVAVLAAWGGMMFAANERGALVAHGLSSLRYFTVLSNLLACAGSAVYAVCLARLLRGSAAAVPQWAVVLKYAGAVSVALTFLTVVLFLGPTAKDGFCSMFLGSNLWFHLIVPLLAVADFCFLNPDGPLPFASSFLACVPMALYAVYYLANILAVGPEKGDWYGFLRGGVPMGAAISAINFLGTWGLALLLRLTHR